MNDKKTYIVTTKPRKHTKMHDNVLKIVEPTPVVIKVNKEGYVPEGITVRAVISPLIFTAVIDVNDVAMLEADTHVVTVRS